VFYEPYDGALERSQKLDVQNNNYVRVGRDLRGRKTLTDLEIENIIKKNFLFALR
jgi:hypothetical protein